MLPGLFSQGADPYAALVAVVDDAFMQLYAHARKNARRIARLALALLPLMVLLVGSCKTVDLSGSYSRSSDAEQIRTAFFPDRVKFTGAAYYPAEGYIARAQKYVSDVPGALEHLTSEDIGYLFGKPALTRRDADAKVLQYKADGCVVDFYFYGDGKTVSYIDVRSRSLAPAALPEKARAKCIGHVIEEGDFSSRA
jgi:hypothetical protein